MLQDMGDHPEAIGARLEALRQAMGLTKRDFAERAGLSENNYNAFSNGKRDLTLVAAKKIRRTYGADLEFLLYGDISRLPHWIAVKIDSSAKDIDG